MSELENAHLVTCALYTLRCTATGGELQKLTITKFDQKHSLLPDYSRVQMLQVAEMAVESMHNTQFVQLPELTSVRIECLTYRYSEFCGASLHSRIESLMSGLADNLTNLTALDLTAGPSSYWRSGPNTIVFHCVPFLSHLTRLSVLGMHQMSVDHCHHFSNVQQLMLNRLDPEERWFEDPVLLCFQSIATLEHRPHLSESFIVSPTQPALHHESDIAEDQ